MTGKNIGVFICRCGGNISDYVDTEKLREAVQQEPGVAETQVNIFTCSDAAQQNIFNAIKEKNLDGMVVASCSPKLHLNTFRALAQRAGLNPYLYTQVNIREQCSWAHTHDKKAATEKALRLIRAGIARTLLSRPLEKLRVDTLPAVLVVGAGVAGLRAALALSDLGMAVHLIEKAAEPGGNVRLRGKLFPGDRNGREMINSLVDTVRRRDNITLFTSAELLEKSGHIGDFAVKIRAGTENISLNVGSIIVTTGYENYMPVESEYGYGSDGIITLPDFEELLSRSSDEIKYRGKTVKTIAYIYCVGSRQSAETENAHQYCSRYCCSAASHAAVTVSDIDKTVHQFHLFRDIRTYGKYELIYEKALEKGSIFLRFDDEPPQVTVENGQPLVRIKDKLTGNEEIEIRSDLVVLVTGMVPREDSGLIDVLKIPTGRDRFFNEIHPKLRPVETVIDGVFIAGTAQGPKNIAESVASSLAAVAKTAALLLKGYVDLEPLVARVDKSSCDGCGQCVATCPYNSIELVKEDGKQLAIISPVLCKGEGGCVPVCPLQAVSVEGYSNQQIECMIDALAKEVSDDKTAKPELSGSAKG